MFTRRLLALAVLLGLTGGVARAQIYPVRWEVTHNSTASAVLTSMEATRATLEKNIALQNGWATVLHTQAVAAENYSWLRGYVSLLRTARMAKQTMKVLGNLNLPLYTLLPNIRIVSPVYFKDPETGEQILRYREVASLSLVPQRYQVGWTAKGALGDDEYSDAPDLPPTGPREGRFLSLTMPNWQQWKNSFVAAPSPFLTDSSYDAEDSLQDVQAHFFESVLDAAQRLAGYGVQVNPLVLSDGTSLMSGRLSPATVRAQASMFQSQAFQVLNKLFSIYTEQGAEYGVVERMQKRERDYWGSFADNVTNQGTARMAFAMNAMNEVHQVMARMENYDHRKRQNEADEALANLGKKRDPVTQDWVPMWEPDPDRPDFYMIMDKLTGTKPWSNAIRLQATGLSARYSYASFQEAEGLRNTLMGLLRMRIALDGIAINSQTLKEIRKMNASVMSEDAMTEMLRTYMTARSRQEAAGWGGLRFDWKAVPR